MTIGVSPEEAAAAILYPELSRRHRSHYMALVVAGLMLIGVAIGLLVFPV